MSADIYVQMQVRLENLKQGEAQAIAKLLKDAQEAALAKLEGATTQWSRERLNSQISTYGQALDQVYASEILPDLADDGLEFVAQNQATHYEALTEVAPGPKGIPVAEKKLITAEINAMKSDRAITDFGEAVQCHLGSEKLYGGLPESMKKHARIIRWEESKWKIVQREIKANTAYKAWKGKGAKTAINLLDDIADGSVNGHSFINYRGHYIDPHLTSAGVPDSQIQKIDSFIEDVYVKAGINTARPADARTVIAGTVTTNLSPAAIYTAAIAEPMQGKLMAEWATQLKRKEVAAVSAALKEAWLAGESTGKSLQKLQPILNRSRRDLSTITRTYYQHLASETQRAVWAENEELMDGIIWDATLDNRTTIDICAPRDQLQYTLKGEPVGHNLSWMGGPGQAHWNCRSSGLPNLKGVDMTVKRRALEPGSNYKEGDAHTRTGRVRKNSKAARDKGIYKQELVDPKTNYETWLKSQGRDADGTWTQEGIKFQDDVLGKAKGQAFREGKYHIGEKFKVVNPTRVRYAGR